MKTCSSCQQEKPRDSFWKRKASPDGLQGICIECKRASYPKSTKRAEENARKRVRAEKACRTCLQVKPLAEYPDLTRSLDGKASRCTECTIAYKQEWCARNAERIAESKRQWAVANDAKRRAARHNYEARKAGAEGRLTKEVIELIFATYGKACLICGATEKIHIDHVVPLSLGGTNLPDNLQPLCEFHNKSKRNRSCADYRPFALEHVK